MFTDQYDLATNNGFIKRVGMAMVKAAVAVCAETYTDDTPARATWATQVLRDPEHYARKMAFGVARNNVITVESSDADIEFTVNSIWNAYAGVQPHETD